MLTDGRSLDPDQTAAAFRSAFGYDPAGVWAAPGRINLIGEHTDYNDGFALPLALPERVYAAAAPRDDGVLDVRSRRARDEPLRRHLAELLPGTPVDPAQSWAAYVMGVAWALRWAGYDVGGADIYVASDLPSGSGLASSAALECAAAVALGDMWALGIEPDELARLAQRAENDFVGMPCGVMDQMASLRCTSGHALFLDCRDLSTAQVPVDLAAAGLRLLVVDTRAPHRHVDGEYASRRRGCEEAAHALCLDALRDLGSGDLEKVSPQLNEEHFRYVRHVVTENARVLATVDRLRAGDVSAAGRLLTESHISLRDDYQVSSPELDVAVDTALAHGALGARMTGGGFGGCAIALVPEDETGTAAAAIDEAFLSYELTRPSVFAALPSAGAARCASQ